MNTRRTGRKKSRTELNLQTNSPSKRYSDPEPEFHMTQAQKIVFWFCVGVGVVASWVLQAVLGMKGIITTAIMSGIGGGVASLVGIGIVFLLMLTPDQKRKHLKRKKK